MRVGMEATGYSRWFERLLAELGIEVGSAMRPRSRQTSPQAEDRPQGCRLLLRLLRENNFPRIWVPSPENRDLRQLLWHRHRMVQMRTRIMNQLQALAMNEGQRGRRSCGATRTSTVGKAFAGYLGITASEGSAGAAGSDKPQNRRVNRRSSRKRRNGPKYCG